ncbi:hypothetical protein GE09DRAFT_65237 [Coniochaeta sp. 2T2.1]|nr:hypothetical protein GE09DRAFT_65237 [Coniochaeta sp. 2T2.1]
MYWRTLALSILLLVRGTAVEAAERLSKPDEGWIREPDADSILGLLDGLPACAVCTSTPFVTFDDNHGSGHFTDGTRNNTHRKCMISEAHLFYYDLSPFVRDVDLWHTPIASWCKHSRMWRYYHLVPCYRRNCPDVPLKWHDVTNPKQVQEREESRCPCSAKIPWYMHACD